MTDGLYTMELGKECVFTLKEDFMQQLNKESHYFGGTDWLGKNEFERNKRVKGMLESIYVDASNNRGLRYKMKLPDEESMKMVDDTLHVWLDLAVFDPIKWILIGIPPALVIALLGVSGVISADLAVAAGSTSLALGYIGGLLYGQKQENKHKDEVLPVFKSMKFDLYKATP
jgi:hypothetical protein